MNNELFNLIILRVFNCMTSSEIKDIKESERFAFGY
jgi:hypothetical protein